MESTIDENSRKFTCRLAISYSTIDRCTTGSAGFNVGWTRPMRIRLRNRATRLMENDAEWRGALLTLLYMLGITSTESHSSGWSNENCSTVRNWIAESVGVEVPR